MKGAALWASALHRAALTGPSVRQVLELFPDLSPSKALAAARSICSLESRRRVYDDFESRVPLGALSPLVAWDYQGPLLELARNRRAAILLTWHTGIVVGLRAGLHKLNVEALILRNMTGDKREEGIRLVGVGNGTPAGRAMALKRALDHLRDGGLVVINIDGLQGDRRVETVCLGRKITYAGGAFTLARLSGAPVIPALTRWSDDTGRIELILHDPLKLSDPAEDVETWERDFARQGAAVFEEFLSRHPGQLPCGWLERFLRAPRASGAEADSGPTLQR